jgi:ribosome-associated translation inhibitor RaiA
MQISVIGPAPLMSQQVRAYAEYRLFTRLAPHARSVAAVQVTVARSTAAGGGSVCSVTADLEGCGRVRTRVRRPQMTNAIDVAAEKVARAAARRLSANQPVP